MVELEDDFAVAGVVGVFEAGFVGELDVDYTDRLGTGRGKDGE